jgi:hypothetical protein
MKPWHEGLPETTEFIILPPEGISVDEALKIRLTTHMAARFPDLQFSVTTAWPGQGGNYGLIPVCGQIGDDGEAELLGPGSDAIVMAIKEALRGFDPARTGLS